MQLLPYDGQPYHHLSPLFWDPSLLPVSRFPLVAMPVFQEKLINKKNLLKVEYSTTNTKKNNGNLCFENNGKEDIKNTKYVIQYDFYRKQLCFRYGTT